MTIPLSLHIINPAYIYTVSFILYANHRWIIQIIHPLPKYRRKINRFSEAVYDILVYLDLWHGPIEYIEIEFFYFNRPIIAV